MVRPLDLAYLSTLLVASPWLAYRAITRGRYRRGISKRFFGSAALPAPKRPRAWFHGVSVGEVHLLRQVIAAFRERRPDWECIVSTSTDTGLDEAKRCFPDLPVITWPLDFSWAVKRALRTVQPKLLVLAEGELWPNMLRACKSRGIPVAVVNGRFSPRSARRYRRFGAIVRPMLHSVSLFAVQTDRYANTLRSLGVSSSHIAVTGSVKYDGLTGDRNNEKTGDLALLFGIEGGDLVWVAGSTQAPEDREVLDLYRRVKARFPKLRLILVPRQRHAFDAVAKLVQSAGLPLVRRSGLQTPVVNKNAVILVDTLGELSAVWGLADIAFVGGSLDGKRGGQNMLEPAAYGSAVVFGPHVWNFRDAAARLVEHGGAVQVKDFAGLESAVAGLAGSPNQRRTLGAAARRFVLSQQGATERTLQALEFLVSPRVLKAG
jgi:3-deoxy-D-manno-octulosonic-acid transferase